MRAAQYVLHVVYITNTKGLTMIGETPEHKIMY